MRYQSEPIYMKISVMVILFHFFHERNKRKKPHQLRQPQTSSLTHQRTNKALTYRQNRKVLHTLTQLSECLQRSLHGRTLKNATVSGSQKAPISQSSVKKHQLPPEQLQ